MYDYNNSFRAPVCSNFIGIWMLCERIWVGTLASLKPFNSDTQMVSDSNVLFSTTLHYGPSNCIGTLALEVASCRVYDAYCLY